MDNLKAQSIAAGLSAAFIAWFSQAWLSMIGDLYYYAQSKSYFYYLFHSTNVFLTLFIGLIVAGTIYLYKCIITGTSLGISNNAKPSLDKKKAKYHIPPKKYLSKVPQYLTLGTVGKGYFKRYVNLPFYNSPNMILCLGAPGAAKTATLMNLLLHNFNYGENTTSDPVSKFRAVMAVDIKPELTKCSVDEDRDDIKIIKPASMDSKYGFDAFYGLSQESSDDELKSRCQLIAKCCIPSLGGDNEYFSTSAQTLMTGFLCHSFRQGLTLGESMVKIKAISIKDHITEIITDPQMRKHPKIVNLVKNFEGDSSDSFKSIQTELIKDIEIFDRDSVRYCLDGNPNKVTPQDLLNGNSVFIQIKDDVLDEYKTLLSLMLEICARKILHQSEESLRGQSPILFLIDEAGVVKIPNLTEKYLATGRSKKLQIVLMCQSLMQLQHLYGKEGADTIVDCCKTVLILSNYNTEECKNFAERCGSYRETKISSKTGNGIFSNIAEGKNISEEYRNCIDVSDIQQLETKNELLVFDKGQWFVCSKAPYFTIPEYRALSEEIIAKNSKNYSDEGDK